MRNKSVRTPPQTYIKNRLFFAESLGGVRGGAEGVGVSAGITKRTKLYTKTFYACRVGGTSVLLHLIRKLLQGARAKTGTKSYLAYPLLSSL